MTTSVYVLENKLLTSDRDRFFNCIIDSFFILLAIFVFTFLVIIIGNVFQWDVYQMWVNIMIDLGMVGTYLSFALLYYLVFEGVFGRTIGKIATGCTVVNENGLKVTFSIICIRTLCRLIPFDAISFLGKSEMFWHDSISKTYVVEKKDLEKEMKLFHEFNSIGINKENS